MDCLTSFLAHAWHLNILFGQAAALPAQPFVYLLSSSIWESNYRYLDCALHHVSYTEIRNPDRSTNDRLHDLRGDLADFGYRVNETCTNMPKELADYYDRFPIIKNRHQRKHLSPVDNHQTMIGRAARLDTLLTDTFQLLMSSLSVRDSQVSIEQARR